MKKMKHLLLVAAMLLLAQNVLLAQGQSREIRKKHTRDSELLQPGDTLEKDYIRAPFHSEWKGSHLNFGVGVGVGGLNYQLNDGSTVPMIPTITGNIGYTYYFLPFMGIGTGATISQYGSYGLLNTTLRWNGVTDKNGNTYDHITELKEWRERQLSYFVEIPLAFHFKHTFKNRLGIYGLIGGKVGIPVYTKANTIGGDVINSGYYPISGQTVTNVPGQFENYVEPYLATDFKLKYSYSAIAEIGLSIQISKRTDFTFGLYGSYGFNDVAGSKASDQSLGFKSDMYPFMNAYNGLFNTNYTGKISTYNGGVKVGLNVYLGSLNPKSTSKNKKKASKANSTVVTKIIRDTVFIQDTIDHYIIQRDTVVKTVNQSQAFKKSATVISENMQGGVIWFEFNKYVPMVKPADLLIRIAKELKANPDMRVQINGHACKLGGDSYNREIALMRAKAVAQILFDLGVKQTQVKVVSFGANVPYTHNTLQHQYSKDRRVEIIVLDAQGKISSPLSYEEKNEEFSEYIGEEAVLEDSRLAQIARRWYGNPYCWIYIYRANKEKIYNPHVIEAGMVLKIPKLTQEQIDNTKE